MNGHTTMGCPHCEAVMFVRWECGHMWDALVKLATDEAAKAQAYQDSLPTADDVRGILSDDKATNDGGEA